MFSGSQERVEHGGRAIAVRSIAGGVLMGLANLVPGISGGTMLLAAGVYREFVGGIAEISTFRFRARTLLTLALIVGAAATAILLLAGPVRDLVIHHRWAMYSLFIGLTLGGVPVLWPMIGRLDAVVVATMVVAVAVMAVMAFIGPGEAAPRDGGGTDHAYVMYFFAGLAGATAMVLPGVSGGYLLLLLGQYVAILSAVSALEQGLADRDWSQIAAALHTVVPVGLGVVAGVVGVSNLVKILLERFERPTLGFLLGLLLGAVIGLWPFQAGKPPEVGAAFRGDVVVLVEGEPALASSGRRIEPESFPTEFFRPSAGQVIGSIGLILGGFGVSMAVARLSAERPTG